MEQEKKVLVEKDGHVAILTINNPPANTWNIETMQAFEQALEEIEFDPEVRVVILTGAGEACFSAGYDVKDAANSRLTSSKGHELWRRFDRFPKPTIAAINGYALGGGCELAVSCHFRIMVDKPKALIGLTELNLGIIPGWGGTQRLGRLVGRSKALDMILFSKRLTAPEAFEIGLVDKVSAPGELMNDAREMAGRIAERPPVAVSMVLKALTAGEYDGLEQGLYVEREGTRAVGRTEDAIEGFTAFLEKRPPVFKGK